MIPHLGMLSEDLCRHITDLGRSYYGRELSVLVHCDRDPSRCSTIFNCEIRDHFTGEKLTLLNLRASDLELESSIASFIEYFIREIRHQLDQAIVTTPYPPIMVTVAPMAGYFGGFIDGETTTVKPKRKKKDKVVDIWTL